MLRLIDISDPSNLKFCNVADPSLVRYAILSHVWNRDEGNGFFTPEPTYQDLTSAMERSCVLPENSRFAKLLGFIRAAAHGGYHLVWADMCCIDKTSSAELSEAIASMYYWYSCAEVCYAYLQDVPSPKRRPDALPPAPPVEFSSSMWFKRAWTLQELIASKSLVFFSTDWRFLGTKRGLSGLVHDITNIDVEVLTHERKLHEVSVACRMSWAADRIASLPEDRAYSLMGIFGVRIPVLYGEREYAFIRLQEEILRRIPDPTLLAWGLQRPLSSLPLCFPEHRRLGETAQTIHVRARREHFSPLSDWDPGYLLATSPEAFRQTGRLTKSAPQSGPVSIAHTRSVLRGGGPYRQNIVPFDMLQMHTPLARLELTTGPPQRHSGNAINDSFYLVPLGCETAHSEPVALLLCPGSSSEVACSAPPKEHQRWVIGGRLPDSGSGVPYGCRIVTLPPPNGVYLQDTVHHRWQEAVNGQDREVYLPLSAPMDRWSAGDPRALDVAARLLRGNQGRFEIRLSEWCKSALDAAGFDIDIIPPTKNNPRHTIVLIPPHSYTLYVKEDDRRVAVEAFEVAFASCPPHAEDVDARSEHEVSPLVGSILPRFASPASSATSLLEQRRCPACPAPVDDHIESSKLWSIQGGVAVRTLQCLIVRSRERHATGHHVGKSFTLSVGLRALLPTPPEPRASQGGFLLEIELYATNVTQPPSSNAVSRRHRAMNRAEPVTSA